MKKELNNQELEKLVAYLDGEVTEQEAIQLADELDQCYNLGTSG